jgi:biotin transport system substrate-specific component
MADILWPARAGGSAAVRSLTLAIAGSLLLWASAKVQVPFYPVPMTLQTAVVFLIGIAYGPVLGVGTVLLYLAQGALGLPVFAGTPAKGIGLAYMLGTTGGYLVGFVVAAAITGWVAARCRHWWELAGGVVLATLVLYALGVAWLSGYVGLTNAVTLGVVPFLLGDIVKVLIVTAVAEAGLSAIGRRGVGP